MDIDHIRQISVVGSGLIGHSIALDFAIEGYKVRLYSRTNDSLKRSRDMIRDSIRNLVRLGCLDPKKVAGIESNICTDSSLNASIIGSDIVIEAVYEDVILKQILFRKLDEICPPHVILASSTSSILPSKLMEFVTRPERVVVAHYINPPHLVPLVEIVRSPLTSDLTVDIFYSLLKKLGKCPVVLPQEIPGFISGRLQMVVLKEALWLVKNGYATTKDVDTVLKSSLGRRWAVAGIFEVLELAGWDLISNVISEIAPSIDTSSESFSLIDTKVSKGELGAKSGKGFYDWPEAVADSVREKIIHSLVEIEKWSE